MQNVFRSSHQEDEDGISYIEDTTTPPLFVPLRTVLETPVLREVFIQFCRLEW